MKPFIDLLAYPHAIDAKLSISDAMITAYLQNAVKIPLLQDIHCRINAGFVQLSIRLGVKIMAKRFTIELEIEDFSLDAKLCILTLRVRNQSLSALSSLLNHLGKSSIAMLRFQQDILHIDLSQPWIDFQLKQVSALQNELKELRVAVPILQAKNVILKITKPQSSLTNTPAGV